MLAGILSWPADSGANRTFADAGEVPGNTARLWQRPRRGYLQGDSDGSFVPGGRLNRAQAAVILSAVLRIRGFRPQAAGVEPYLDDADIPAWAAPAVAEATALGLCGKAGRYIRAVGSIYRR